MGRAGRGWGWWSPISAAAACTQAVLLFSVLLHFLCYYFAGCGAFFSTPPDCGPEAAGEV